MPQDAQRNVRAERRTLRRAIAVAAVIAAGMTFTGTAVGAPGPGGQKACPVAEAKGTGSAPLAGGAPATGFAFDFCHPSFDANDVKGDFRTTGGPGPSGPVVCSDFDKNSVTFLVRDDKVPEGKPDLHLVVAVDGGPGAATDKISVSAVGTPETFRFGCNRTADYATSAKKKAAPVAAGDITIATHF